MYSAKSYTCCAKRQLLWAEHISTSYECWDMKNYLHIIGCSTANKKNQSSVLLATRQVNHPDFCHKGHVMQKLFQCSKAIMAILCTMTHQMETFSALLSLCAGNSPVTGEFPEQKLWCFSLICAWINAWENNREAGNLRRHHAHYDVTVMCSTLGVIFPSLLS